MTAVVGIRTSTGVLLAGDLQGTVVGWGSKTDRVDAKTVQLSPLVALAYCGSYRMGQVLRYHVSLPSLPLGYDEYEWAVRSFVPAARTALKDAGVLHVKDGVERLDGGFLLAIRARLLYVEGDLQVGEDMLPYAADGSGGEAAAGHLSAIVGDDPIEDRRALEVARGALATAAKMNAYVGGQTTHVRTVQYTKAERDLAAAIVKRKR